MFLSWQTEVYLHDKTQVCNIVLLCLNKLLQYIPAIIQSRNGLALETGFRFILQSAHMKTFHFIKPLRWIPILVILSYTFSSEASS